MHGEQVVAEVEVGEVEAGHPLHGRQRVIEGVAKLLGERDEVGRGRRPVEAADTWVDRVDRPAADGFEDRVSRLLQAKPRSTMSRWLFASVIASG